MQYRHTLLMKVLFLVVVVLLVGGVGLDAQQDDGCDIDITAVYGILAQVQVAKDGGNTDDALKLIGDAQDFLESIQQSCGVVPADVAASSPASSGQRSGESRGRIIYVAEPSSTSSTGFEKLEALAFMNGFDVVDYYDISTGSGDLPTILQEQDDIGAVIYGKWDQYTDDEVQAMAEFVAGGGRVFLMYDEYWEEINDILRENFGVMVVGEDVDLGTDTHFIYDSSMQPGWMNGLEVGFDEARAVNYVGVLAYIAAPGNEGERGYVTLENGAERLVTYTTADKRVTFFPIARQRGYNQRYTFFEDIYIEQVDNEAATRALLEFLLNG